MTLRKWCVFYAWWFDGVKLTHITNCGKVKYQTEYVCVFYIFYIEQRPPHNYIFGGKINWPLNEMTHEICLYEAWFAYLIICVRFLLFYLFLTNIMCFYIHIQFSSSARCQSQRTTEYNLTRHDITEITQQIDIEQCFFKNIICIVNL